MGVGVMGGGCNGSGRYENTPPAVEKKEVRGLAKSGISMFFLTGLS